MSLRIRRLKLIATTLNGDYASEMEFPDGLVLLHLHNTRGKSTAFKAIIYALGLERMFGQINQAPLTPAMTTRLKDGGAEWDVAESWVYLEISNGEGRVATLRRKVAGDAGQDRKIVDVWERGILSNQDALAGSTAFYARDPGSAQNEQGIAFWLAKFVGWNLPSVARHDGSLGLLYMECLMSLFFVEQSQGWTGIQAVTPHVFGIRQVEKKALEFVLRLDATQTDAVREKLEQREHAVRSEWSQRRTKLEALARSLRGALRNVPTDPEAIWPPTPNPFIETFQDGAEVPLVNAIDADKETVARLEKVDIPTADEAAAQISEKLQLAVDSLAEAESIGASLEDDITVEQASLYALETRLKVVDEDLVRNRDLKKIRDLRGASQLAISRNECPTCHQHVNDTLLSQKIEQEVMGLDENLAYLTAQRQTLEKMRERTAGAIEALLRKRSAVTAYADDLRARIRSLKRTLVSAGIAPSEAAIRERIVVDERLQQRLAAQSEYETITEPFPRLAREWAEIQLQLRATRGQERSASDREKVSVLTSLFKEALDEFGFESFPLDTVILDPDTYRPKREGFDLAHSVSASDHIRIIAAYITALLETARKVSTNHLGLLLLDEPRQQNMQWPDFAKILRRLSDSLKAGQQVIVATSDRPDAIRDTVKDIPHTRVAVEYDEWLLKKVVPSVERAGGPAEKENPETP